MIPAPLHVKMPAVLLWAGRVEHFDPDNLDRWVRRGYNASLTSQYLTAVQSAIEHPNLVQEVRAAKQHIGQPQPLADLHLHALRPSSRQHSCSVIDMMCHTHSKMTWCALSRATARCLPPAAADVVWC